MNEAEFSETILNHFKDNYSGDGKWNDDFSAPGNIVGLELGDHKFNDTGMGDETISVTSKYTSTLAPNGGEPILTPQSFTVDISGTAGVIGGGFGGDTVTIPDEIDGFTFTDSETSTNSYSLQILNTGLPTSTAKMSSNVTGNYISTDGGKAEWTVAGL